jgi:hypothetical protein
MKEDVRRIDIKEFRRLGVLQEANRKFFHPLGLALEVIINEEDGTETLGGIWDYREDPEGNFFSNDMIKQEAIDYVENLRKSKIKARKDIQEEYNVKVDKSGIQIKG